MINLRFICANAPMCTYFSLHGVRSQIRIGARRWKLRKWNDGMQMRELSRFPRPGTDSLNRDVELDELGALSSGGAHFKKKVGRRGRPTHG
jgi:hypothetical protein